MLKVELDLARELLVKHGQAAMQELLPKVVKRLKVRWPDAKSFGAISRYLPEVIQESHREKRRMEQNMPVAIRRFPIPVLCSRHDRSGRDRALAEGGAGRNGTCRSGIGHTLFNIHLAIEKALKAQFMDQHRKNPPMTHDLERLALELKPSWKPAEMELIQELTQYAIAARYDDPVWAEHEATSENAIQRMHSGQAFLNTFLP